MSTSTTSSGIGFCSALFLLFIGLRLTGHIDWAWYWVASPLIAIPALIIVILLVVGLAFVLRSVLGSACDGIRRIRRRRFNKDGVGRIARAKGRL